MEEFVSFLSPRIANQIQAKTRPLRRKQGKCQDCGEKDELQAAHPKDNDRRNVIITVLQKHVVNGKLVIDNLQQVENEILDAHKPYEKFFRFICQACHQKEHYSKSSGDVEARPIMPG